VKSRSQSYIIYLLLFIAIIAMVVYNFSSSGNSQDVLNINEVAAGVENNTIKKISIEDNNNVKLTYADGSQKSSTKEADTTLVSQLIALGVKPEQLTPDKVEIEVKAPSLLLYLPPGAGQQ
jgi:cell division protease FtsH